MNALLKTAARALLGDYAIYFVYRLDKDAAPAPAPPGHGKFSFEFVDEASARASVDPLIQSQIEYVGAGAWAFACRDGARVVGLCFYWAGDRYRRRNFWPLADDEAKLVQLVTLPEMRGRGIAGDLIGWSSRAMFDQGFRQLFARIWHSNKPSWRAFERAHWKRAALVVEISPLKRARPVRIRIGRRPSGRTD
ncbi:GNAT family N-acetyltransferase [Scleromatobacter humisilvae]|uniref:GNAT family N-acetyltransferase n=1 Tax=Scleromatobacter humisilvae TaxID=2897159 RepID=A0A9X1YIK6_9BURK|nr:GNAT family protein [Scleromatobacter humisilvae]MCK9686085.1 GNAT family N-acetyltransferase [Scleromatobacter humisilvae]